MTLHCSVFSGASRYPWPIACCHDNVLELNVNKTNEIPLNFIRNSPPSHMNVIHDEEEEIVITCKYLDWSLLGDKPSVMEKTRQSLVLLSNLMFLSLPAIFSHRECAVLLVHLFYIYLDNSLLSCYWDRPD